MIAIILLVSLLVDVFFLEFYTEAPTHTVLISVCVASLSSCFYHTTLKPTQPPLSDHSR